MGQGAGQSTAVQQAKGMQQHAGEGWLHSVLRHWQAVCGAHKTAATYRRQLTSVMK